MWVRGLLLEGGGGVRLLRASTSRGEKSAGDSGMAAVKSTVKVVKASGAASSATVGVPEIWGRRRREAEWQTQAGDMQTQKLRLRKEDLCMQANADSDSYLHRRAQGEEG